MGIAVKVESKVICLTTFFILIVHINPRDVPLPQLPMIYVVWPLTMLYLYRYYKDAVKKGIRSSAVLVAIVACSWFMRILLPFINVQADPAPLFMYATEAVMLLVFSASVASTRDGYRSLAIGFILAVSIGTIWGFGSMHGEFFRAVDLYLHRNISMQGEQTIMSTVDDIKFGLRNAGLTGTVFTFSYQLVMAATIIICVTISNVRYKAKAIFIVFAPVVFLGVIFNAERSPVLSIAGSYVCYSFLHKKISYKKHILSFLLLLIAPCLVVIMGGSKTIESDSMIFSRLDDHKEKTDPRFKMAAMAALSPLKHPIGNNGMSDYYTNHAFDERHLRWEDGVPGPQEAHNHFANQMMYLGIPGVAIVVVLVLYVKRIMWAIWNFGNQDVLVCAFAAALFGVFLNSCAHNAGVFSGELASCTCLGAVSAWYGRYKMTTARHRR